MPLGLTLLAGMVCAKHDVKNYVEARAMVNTGQVGFVIGAFVILSTLTLNVNATLINTTTTGLEMEAMLDALSVGQTMLDEVLTKEFDERTLNGVRAFSYTDITPSFFFGPDGSTERILENHGVDTSSTGNFLSKKRFDDVDDYNNYHRRVWNPRFGWFDVRVDIEYLDEDYPEMMTSWRTFYKGIAVTITHPNLVKDLDQNVIPLVLRDMSVYRRYF